MQAFQGYFEQGQFIPLDTIRIPDRRRVIVTVLDEAIPDEVTKQKAAWSEFFKAIQASGEEVPETFERVNFSREIDL